MKTSEIQVLIDYTKGMIADNKEPEKKVIIALCNELERINNLKPVGYINPVAQLCIKRKLNAAIKPSKEDNSIPLYRLDK